MEALWGDIFSTFQLYNGKSLIFFFYILILIYLGIKEKDKSIKALIVYASIGILAVFFCPITEYVLVTAVGDLETYYRFLWMAPIFIAIAYGVMKMIIAQKKLINKLCIMLAACLCIILNGSYVYDNDFFSETENIYQIPEIAVDICQSIEVEGREVKAVVPRELLQFVRQYSAYVHLAYGREMLVERWEWNDDNELHDAMEAMELDVELVTRLAREDGNQFIIVNELRANDAEFLKYNYKLHEVLQGYEKGIGKDSDYYIYVDEEANLTLLPTK